MYEALRTHETVPDRNVLRESYGKTTKASIGLQFDENRHRSLTIDCRNARPCIFIATVTFRAAGRR